MRKVFEPIRASTLAGADYLMHFIDVRVVEIVLRGSLTAFLVYLILASLSLVFSLFSSVFGHSWIGSYIELFHIIFSLIIFAISCIIDLISYWLQTIRKLRAKNYRKQNNIF